MDIVGYSRFHRIKFALRCTFVDNTKRKNKLKSNYVNTLRNSVAPGRQPGMTLK